VIEDRESTFVINGRAAIMVDASGNLVVEPEYASRQDAEREEQAISQ
jgi:hypothetical protein